MENWEHVPAYSTLFAVKRVLFYSCKMFTFKTEVLWQSRTTAATGLTSFIYLKYQHKKNMKDPSTNARFEDQQSLSRAKTALTTHVVILRVMLNAIFYAESLRQICTKYYRNGRNAFLIGLFVKSFRRAFMRFSSAARLTILVPTSGYLQKIAFSFPH